MDSQIAAQKKENLKYTFLFLSTKKCDGFDQVIPSKNKGYISVKGSYSRPSYRTANRETVTNKWVYVKDEVEVENYNYYWYAAIAEAFTRLSIMQSKRVKEINYVYMFDGLIESEIAWIKLALDYEKILAVETSRGNSFSLVLECVDQVEKFHFGIAAANSALIQMQRWTVLADKNKSLFKCVNDTASAIWKYKGNKKMLNALEKQFDISFKLPFG